MIDGSSKEVSLMTFLQDKVGIHGWEQYGGWADVIGAVMFALLGMMLVKTAMKKD
jgi:hypothetical protein